MKIIVTEQGPEYDHDTIRFVEDGEEKGFGYIGHESNSIGLMKCPQCNLGNYAMAVPSGTCYSCGFNANKIEIIEYKQPEDANGDTIQGE